MKTDKRSNSKREDVPATGKGIQNNLPGQGQQEDTQQGHAEFLDNQLDEQARVKDGSNQEKNNKELISKWEEIRIYFMAKNPDLTDADVTHGENEDDFSHMLERIEKKTGKSKEQLREEIRMWEDVDSLKGSI